MTHKDALAKLRAIVTEFEGCPIPSVDSTSKIGCHCESSEDCPIGALMETEAQAVKDIEELAASKRIIFERFTGFVPKEPR